MTGGGPATSTNVLVCYLYTTAFGYYKLAGGDTGPYHPRVHHATIPRR